MPRHGIDPRMTRRDWMTAVGAAALAPGLTGAAEGDLRARARKNLKLAVFTGVYSRFPLEEAAGRIKADGFAGVVLEYSFADVRFDPMNPDWDAAKKITDCFRRHDVKIAGLWGYYNVVDPIPERRKRGEDRMRLLIAHWKRLGSPIISTETGTLNPESEWLDSPENVTEKAYLQCRSAFQSLAKAAEKTGAIIGIEPYWRNIIDSARRAERLFREVGSPALRLIMDPCNYYRKEDLERMGPILQEIFRRVGPQTVLAHAKDVKAAAEGTDLPAAGKGVLNYPLYLRLLARLDREIYLAVEHLTLEDVPRARDYVKSQIGKV